MSVALDPIEAARSPGRFRLTLPPEVFVNNRAFVDRLTRRLIAMEPYLEGHYAWGDEAPAHPWSTFELVSLPWQRRRVGRMFGELVLWLDAWADANVTGGRMALRAAIHRETESLS